MVKEDDIVGGEQSGHIIFKEHEATGDGLVTALMFLTIMKDTGRSALELREGLKIYPQLLVNVRVRDKEEAMNDPEVKAAIDEVNAHLAGNGRLLVRPSGTEPLVRVMLEGESQTQIEMLANEIAEVVREKLI